MKSEYRQAIQIGQHIADILSLPCVEAVRKVNTKNGQAYIFEVHTEDEPTYFASQGEWICEDYEGLWHVISDLKMTKIHQIESGIYEYEGVPFREVDNEIFSAEKFYPESYYIKAQQSPFGVPRFMEDIFLGYVPDNIFYHCTDHELENYVNGVFGKLARQTANL